MRHATWVMSVVLFAVSSIAARAQQAGPEKEGDPRERAEAMERDRAYPFGETTRSAVLAARAVSVRGGLPLSSLALAVAPWRSVGPFGFQNNGYYGSSPQADGGRITSVAVHPRTTSTYYVGSASGGVWRTINSGATWVPLTDAQCSLTTGAIALDPVDPNIIYVGTGEPTQSSGCGLLRSFDAGATWTEINGGGVLAPISGVGNQTYRIAIDRTTAGSRSNTVVLYAASNGLHRSINSGNTWVTVLTGRVTDVRADPKQTDVFWAAVSNDNTRGGIYKSIDRGATWTRVYTSPTGNGRTGLTVSAAAPNKVWAAVSVAATNRMGTLLVYDDSAATATVLAATGLYNVTVRGDFGAQSSYDLVLEADPTDARTLYLGGTRIYRSRDGGNTFDVVAYNTHVDWHALEFAPSDPTVIVGGCDGGVHVSYDAGNSFISRNTNIVVTQYYPGLAVHPTLTDVLVGGLQDNSSLMGFGSGYWTYVSGGDGGAAAFNSTNPNIFWSTCQNAGCIYRSTRPTSGNGLSVIDRGFSSTDRKKFLPPIVVDPNLGTTLYYGTYRLYRTLNEGASGAWTAVSTDLSKGTGYINTIAVAPSDSRVIWIGTNDGNVQLSVDAAATFTNITNGLPNRAVTRISVDALDAKRALITLSGFGTAHVYLTIDQGMTWQNLSASLPDLPFNASVIIPGTNRFFVGADIGIYETNDAGATWTTAFSSMPNVIVTDLVFQQATGNLYAGTYGRGIYVTQLLTGAALLRGDVNRDGVVNAFDALLVQQALVGVLPSSAQNPMPAGDANCNGKLDSGDVLAILQFTVGSAPVGLCVGTVR